MYSRRGCQLYLPQVLTEREIEPSEPESQSGPGAVVSKFGVSGARSNQPLSARGAREGPVRPRPTCFFIAKEKTQKHGTAVRL